MQHDAQNFHVPMRLAAATEIVRLAAERALIDAASGDIYVMTFGPRHLHRSYTKLASEKHIHNIGALPFFPRFTADV